jgi:fructose-specific phosphotransferase system IIC component
MKKTGTRAIFFGIALFAGFMIGKVISNNPITYKSFIPALVGGLAGGIVIYFVGNRLQKKR